MTTTFRGFRTKQLASYTNFWNLEYRKFHVNSKSDTCWIRSTPYLILYAICIMYIYYVGLPTWNIELRFISYSCVYIGWKKLRTVTVVKICVHEIIKL